MKTSGAQSILLYATHAYVFFCFCKKTNKMIQSYAEVLEGESEVWASTERSARNPPPGWDFLIWADFLRFESSQVSEIAMLLLFLCFL